MILMWIIDVSGQHLLRTKDTRLPNLMHRYIPAGRRHTRRTTSMKEEQSRNSYTLLLMMVMMMMMMMMILSHSNRCNYQCTNAGLLVSAVMLRLWRRVFLYGTSCTKNEHRYLNLGKVTRRWCRSIRGACLFVKAALHFEKKFCSCQHVYGELYSFFLLKLIIMTKPGAIYRRNHLPVLVCMRAGHLARKSLTSNSSLTVVTGNVKRQYEPFVVSRLWPSVRGRGLRRCSSCNCWFCL
jgi:hypothetical protein